MTFAVVRIRGTVNIKGDIRDTLKMLRLNRANHCVIIPDNPYFKGMLNKAKDYITWGEAEPDILTIMLHNHGHVMGNKLNDSYIKNNTGYKSLRAYAKAVCEGKEVLSKLKGIKPVLRLHPPLKGYEGVKKPFKEGGALGYRGAEINRLLQRMIAPKMEKKAEKTKKAKVKGKKPKVKKAKVKKARKKKSRKASKEEV
jgi:large subunit ribosomal protein L30